MADSRLKTNTTEEQNNISLYFADAKKEKLLTREEEIELTKRLKEGDAEARSKLIRSNLRFVITIAKQYKNSGLLLEDLIIPDFSYLLRLNYLSKLVYKLLIYPLHLKLNLILLKLSF